MSVTSRRRDVYCFLFCFAALLYCKLHSGREISALPSSPEQMSYISDCVVFGSFFVITYPLLSGYRQKPLVIVAIAARGIRYSCTYFFHIIYSHSYQRVHNAFCCLLRLSRHCYTLLPLDCCRWNCSRSTPKWNTAQCSMCALLQKYFLCIPLYSAQSCVIPLGNIVRQFPIYVCSLPLHSSRVSDDVSIHRVIADGMFSAYAFAGWQWTPSANWSRCLTRFHILSEWDFPWLNLNRWAAPSSTEQHWIPLFYFYCSLRCLRNLFVAHSILVARLVHTHFHYY